MRKDISRLSLFKIALVAGSALALPSIAYAEGAEAAEANAAVADEPTAANDIVVTGFRQSLEAAINLKRESVSSIDAIVAEDIAKFPDQNLAESLQRIPGITIQRDGGEGRAITVRGLSAEFTRVRVNGLETITTTSDGASPNRGRSFDFNVFASELFSNLVVHKTAEASLDEGSLGAVIDLNTGNPLAAKAGLTGVLSVVGSYNDLSKNVGPRLAGLVNWRNDAGTLGASFSAAYTKTDTLELGNNSVRWAQAPFDSVNGTRCFTAPNTGGSYVTSAPCDAAALSFHPRIPRYGRVEHHRERLGLTGSLQFEPTDSTKLSIDGLYSRFKDFRDEQWAEVLFRGNERAIDVVNPIYDSNGNMVAGTFNDAYVRTENFHREPTTTFYQLGGSWDQDVSDSFRFTLMGGFSKSTADVPVESTIAFDDRDAQGFSYDYRDMKSPKITFGTSVTNPANFQLAEIRDAVSENVNKFKTVQLRTEWDVNEDFKIRLGGVWRRYDFDLVAGSRNSAVCGNGGLDLVLGTLACSRNNVFGPGAVYGFPVTPNLAMPVSLGNAGQPSGNTNDWIVADLPASATFTNLYNRPVVPDVNNVRGVQETTKGGYLQFDAKGEIAGLRYALNAGIRYVKTDQSSYGLVTSSQGSTTQTARVTVERSYDDWLPSANLALYPTDNLVVRGAIAKVITRPPLDKLTPGGRADGFQYTVTFGNPTLDPYRATNFDLSVEWYFAPGAVLSVAAFKKDISSFPVARNSTGTFTQTGLPASVLLPSSPAFIDPAKQSQSIWTISTTVNGTGASLKGLELALQIPFKVFTEGFFSRFGILANATFVSSNAPYKIQGPAIVAGGGLSNQDVVATLLGLSKRAYNGTLYYEDDKFGARVSASYRSGYNDAVSSTGNVFEGYGATTNLDASIRYKLTEWIELSVEGNNLLDTYRYRFVDADTQRNFENNHFGRTILFGARLKM